MKKEDLVLEKVILSFADWFFDGFAVDWMVQSRINQAKEQVEEAIYRVERILSGLR